VSERETLPRPARVSADASGGLTPLFGLWWRRHGHREKGPPRGGAAPAGTAAALGDLGRPLPAQHLEIPDDEVLVGLPLPALLLEDALVEIDGELDRIAWRTRFAWPGPALTGPQLLPWGCALRGSPPLGKGPRAPHGRGLTILCCGACDRNVLSS